MSQSKNVLKEFGKLQVSGAAISHKQSYEELTVASTLDLTDSGKSLYLNSATEFATTLPAVASAAGFKVRFVIKGAPSGASYTVVSPAADVHGSIITADDAAGASAKTAGTAVDTVTFVDSKAVVGDYVDVECDGTFYYVSGSAAVFDGITLS